MASGNHNDLEQTTVELKELLDKTLDTGQETAAVTSDTDNRPVS